MNVFLITIDVEDWFQVENFKAWIPFDTWPQRELRVERNVHRLLDLFDSIPLPAEPGTGNPEPGTSEPLNPEPGTGNPEPLNLPTPNPEPHPSFPCHSEPCVSRVRNPQLGRRAGVDDIHQEIPRRFAPRNDNGGPFAPNPEPGTLNPEPGTGNLEPGTGNLPTRNLQTTFFILGWIAERLPHLVREIQRRGHEVASHGFGHELPQKLSREELRQDLEKSRKLLEDITGGRVVGYRAPSFAIDAALLDALAQAGYRYDSSYNSFALHGRYGKMTLPAEKKNGVAVRFDNGLFELPVSNLRLGDRILPWAGGGYFRLMPAGLFINGVRSILARDGAYVFYMHPWEVDADQPRVAEANRWFKFRHYVNLDRTEAKLRRLIESFPECRFLTCREHLTEVPGFRTQG